MTLKNSYIINQKQCSAKTFYIFIYSERMTSPYYLQVLNFMCIKYSLWIEEAEEKLWLDSHKTYYHHDFYRKERHRLSLFKMILSLYHDGNNSQACHSTCCCQISGPTCFVLFCFLFYFYFFKFYFIFNLYKIVLVLPNIKMNPPQVYMCSPS